MKKYLFTHVLFILLCGQYAMAQQSINEIIAKFLFDNKNYFESAGLNENGFLEIQANESAYTSIGLSTKMAIFRSALEKWDGVVFFVHSGYKRELWRRDVRTGAVSQLGLWDLNNPELYKYLPRTLQTTRSHPWFFYVGGAARFDSENLHSVFFSTRFGFFLLKNRWDLALSGSVGINDNSMVTIITAELGLLSKVYFPIRKLNLSPYFGAGLSVVYTTTEMSLDMGNGAGYNNLEDSYLNPMGLAGVSWYVGPGSLDVGAQIGKTFAVTLGYTFSF